MKNILRNIVCSAMALMGLAACSKQEDVFQRDTDAISVSCNAQSVRHYVLVSGHWTLETDEDWLSFEPASGDGDGVYFQTYYVNVAYNRGAAREGVFYLCHNGQRASVTVSQAECSFKYGKVSLTGSLKKGEPSAASVQVAYSGANGDETASYSGTITGAGAAGLSIESGTLSVTEAGSGSVTIPVTGTPTSDGDITIEITIDGKSVGSVDGKVAASGSGLAFSGLPCGWNFYALGMAAADIQTDATYGKNWFNVLTADAYVPATSGDNKNAKFTSVFVKGTCAGRTFNPSIQAKGLLEGDYWLATIPVTGLEANTKLKIEVGCGSAGSSVGFYMMEYSSDGMTWTVVPGATDQTRGTDTFKSHLWNTPSSISMTGYTNTRKTYDKDTDDTYHAYELAAPAIDDGILYIRLRVLKYRATPDSTLEVAAGWTDIKGLEVSVVK